jgi:stress-induced-phosphoprotein 1
VCFRRCFRSVRSCGLGRGSCPANPEAEAKAKGNALFKQEKNEQALIEYERAIRLDPTDLTYAGNKATALGKLGRHQEAVDLLLKTIMRAREAAATSSDAFARAYGKLALAYVGLKDLASAVDAFKASLLEKPDAGVRAQLKQYHAELEKKEAMDYEDEALAIEAKEQGNTHFRADELAQAVAAYTEAIKRAPRNATMYSNRAAAYLKLKEYQQAIDDCEKALQLDPKFVRAYTRKASCHYELKEFAKARELYQTAKGLDPDNKDVAEGLALLQGK